ncbi:hypothetical protein PR048_001692 [Dryococelus australis]|uniref:PiggyBac transposable element-derived protein domain-containing protein n=1 Tax=Dryococelus australis TaxID=614101 RepID=A0ABQ9IKI3_9NEOP|nr:hypothetical protein PR048_001692 [Dryococelus australis]
MSVRSGVSGTVQDFMLYAGEDTFHGYQFSNDENALGHGGKVIVALFQSVPNQNCSVVYLNNYYCSLELIHHLCSVYGIFSVGTLRSNRLWGWDRKLDATMKKEDRGRCDALADNEKCVAVVKWYDNKVDNTCQFICQCRPILNNKMFLQANT